MKWNILYLIRVPEHFIPFIWMIHFSRGKHNWPWLVCFQWALMWIATADTCSKLRHHINVSRQSCPSKGNLHIHEENSVSCGKMFSPYTFFFNINTLRISNLNVKIQRKAEIGICLLCQTTKQLTFIKKRIIWTKLPKKAKIVLFKSNLWRD